MSTTGDGTSALQPAAPGPASANDGQAQPMRARIKALARDLLVQYGYRGVSFGDLAAALNTTRANIHYHFGHKRTLVEEVLVEYALETISMTTATLQDPDLSFVEKIETMVAQSRRRYLRYNQPGREGRPWSLIARMRQDQAFLTPAGHEALQRFADDLHTVIRNAVADAKKKREFVASMPVDDVALQLFSIANSASPITQDAGNFDRLEQLYMGFTRIIIHAFGNRERPDGG